MKVLVLESDQGAAGVAVGNLEAAGHGVFRCHEPSAHPFPCGALERGGVCPLVKENIDVALAVRSRPEDRPLPLEDGVACALRYRVPLVVAGDPSENPYESWHPVVVEGDDVVAACEQAARSVNLEMSEAATAMLRAALELSGHDTEAASATVARNAGVLEAALTIPPGVDKRAASEASVRVAGALRLLDRNARGIDVSIAS